MASVAREGPEELLGLLRRPELDHARAERSGPGERERGRWIARGNLFLDDDRRA